MKRIAILLSLVNFGVVAQLQEVSGTLDPTFGGMGTGFNFFNLPGGNESFRDVAIDMKGRIVTGGSGGAGASDALIVRFSPKGLLDNTFGGSGTGFNRIPIGGSDAIESIAIDSQGRIVAGGLGGAGFDALIMRFTPDGELDTTFGGSGTGFNLIAISGAADPLNSIAIDSQGRIVAGGQGGASTDALIMRFTPDGELDTTFGGSGTGFNLINIGGGDALNSIAIDSQGRIVAGGLGGASTDALIMRFTPDGELDTTFGGSGTGFNLIDIGGSDRIISLVFDPQGRIVAGGLGGASTDALIMRFTPDGELDTTFGGSGTGFNLIDIGGTDALSAIAIDTSGNIIGGGFTGNPSDILILRFTSTGELDLSFGAQGTGITIIDQGGFESLVSLLINAQGRIIGVGEESVADNSALIMSFYNQPLVQFTTALREKYCGSVNTNN